MDNNNNRLYNSLKAMVIRNYYVSLKEDDNDYEPEWEDEGIDEQE